jgi:hypothetical protein
MTAADGFGPVAEAGRLSCTKEIGVDCLCALPMGGAEVLSIIGSADVHGGCTLEITDICLAGTISAPGEMN